jgi:type III pantothenate kinase
MIILLDIGNSRIKWGWLDGATLQSGQPLANSGDFCQALEAAWRELPAPQRVVASNVAGAERGQALDRWLQQRYGIRAQFASARAQAHGVSNGYREPIRLGCDRWVALVALRHGWPGPACVLDAGTAATFDLLDSAGRHQGGAIIPGLQLMARSLASHTAQIGDTAAAGGWQLGDHTGAAIHCGALHAVAGMAERLRRQASQTLGQPVAGVLTGGDGAALAAALGPDWSLAPDLLLQGLRVIAQETP